jgi:hypothetical protein
MDEKEIQLELRDTANRIIRENAWVFKVRDPRISLRMDS